MDVYKVHTLSFQKLQTFHHAKPYNKSPMKSTDLAEIRKNSMEYDPRPVSRRKMPGYPAMFRNKVLSFRVSRLTYCKYSLVIHTNHTS